MYGMSVGILYDPYVGHIISSQMLEKSYQSPHDLPRVNMMETNAARPTSQEALQKQPGPTQSREFHNQKTQEPSVVNESIMGFLQGRMRVSINNCLILTRLYVYQP